MRLVHPVQPAACSSRRLALGTATDASTRVSHAAQRSAGSGSARPSPPRALRPSVEARQCPITPIQSPDPGYSLRWIYSPTHNARSTARAGSLGALETAMLGFAV